MNPLSQTINKYSPLSLVQDNKVASGEKHLSLYYWEYVCVSIGGQWSGWRSANVTEGMRLTGASTVWTCLKLPAAPSSFGMIVTYFSLLFMNTIVFLGC